MGAKQSSSSRVRTYSNAGQGPAAAMTSNGAGLAVGGAGASGLAARARTRSLGSVQNGAHGQPLSIPSSNGGPHGAGSPDSDASTPEEQAVAGPFASRLLQASSLPVHLLPFHGIKCPVCSKFVPPEDIECHLVMCLTKPRISYNEDILTEDKGECVICFEDLQQGDTIARLPCLCIYHKGCIDSWFKVNRSCPEHPND